jgi:hypothetical protein
MSMAEDIAERNPSEPAPVAEGLSLGDMKALEEYLRRLEEVGAGLWRDAGRYILFGLGEDVLQRIVKPQGAPAAVSAHMHGESSDGVARRLFLELEGWDAETIWRLGEVIAAYLKARLYTVRQPGAPETPKCLRALLHVGAACLRGFAAAPEKPSWLLTGPRCVELLDLDGGDHATLARAMFASPEPTLWHDPDGDNLLTMPGLAAAFAQAPERTLVGVRSLDFKARLRFIAFLGREGVAREPAFFDFLFDMILNGGKREAETALTTLTSCEEVEVCERAVQLLGSERADDRAKAVRILANVATPSARSLIERHVAKESARKVLLAIDEALRSMLPMERPATAAGDAAGYVSIDGDWIALPPADATPAETPLPQGFASELRAAVEEANHEDRRLFAEDEMRIAQLPPEERDKPFNKRAYVEHYSVEAIPGFVDVAAGRIAPRHVAASVKALAGGSRHGPTASAAYQQRLNALLAHPAITPHHLARIAALSFINARAWVYSLLIGSYSGAPAERLLATAALSAKDLRTPLRVCAGAGCDPQYFLTGLSDSYYSAGLTEHIESHRDRLWPVVAEQMETIDQALGLAPTLSASSFNLLHALDVLATLPAPPRRYLQILLGIAISGQKDSKMRARAILSSTRSATALILPLLEDSALSRRASAADWLRARRDRAAIPALRAALAGEKTEAGRAAMLTALIALGEDIADQFSETRLLAEAKAGLAKAKSTVGDCVPLDHLPALAWRDGRRVPADVVRWWVVLADKLKNARGDPLLNIALDRLEKASAERLALFMMSAFIACDTRRPTVDEANAYAQANAPQYHQTYRKWLKDFTLEQAFASLKSQRLEQYLGSAVGHRGVLALVRRAPAVEAVDIVKAFFRDHHARAQQCRALLDALANSSSPSALQFVLAISTRYRTPGVRKHAAALIASVADERGWTRDELADRTIPTGGLDEAGVLALAVAGKAYSASISADLKATLRNPDGKIVQALPGGESDDATAARKAFSNLKKEVKQTQQQQAARLYEAMCVERVWQTADIDAFLFRHPIVGRLCQRLVFAGLDQDGRLAACFRPLGDGTFTNAQDEPVALSGFSGVRLAHRALLDAGQAEAWLRHLADYAIAPLFAQLTRPFLSLPPERGAETEIKDREGFMMEAFTLRGAAAKFGYQRSQNADGGFFVSYQKFFSGIDCSAFITFSGTSLPEANVPCALMSLSFVRAVDTVRQKTLPLSSIAPVLLSESWNDFHAIAAAGSGFDPEWPQKVQS